MATTGGSGGGGGGELNSEKNPGTVTTSMATFPRRNQLSNVEPIKLEMMEEDASDQTNPNNMLQVYALAAFMIGRWIWAKWKERRDRID